MISQFHIIFTCFASGPNPAPQNRIFVIFRYICHMIFIFLYIPGLGPLSIPQSLKSHATCESAHWEPTSRGSNLFTIILLSHFD